MPSMYNKVVVFDLDDTLYKEIDFLKSGFHYIAHQLNGRYPLALEENLYNTMLITYKKGGNAFDAVVEGYGLYKHPKEVLLKMYREHKPKIQLSDKAAEVLDYLKHQGVILALITDGRDITQRNKIEALQLGRWIDTENIIINTEESFFKPSPISYQQLMTKYGNNSDYTYVGDNVKKDFLAPNMLGWRTICLVGDGSNIHPQSFEIEQTKLAQIRINDLRELIEII